MILRQVLKILINSLLMVFILMTIYISLFNYSLLIYEPTPYIETCGLIFSIVFVLGRKWKTKMIEYTNFKSLIQEQKIELTSDKFEKLIFLSFLKSEIMLIVYGSVNLLLTLINIIVNDYTSWGNIIFTGFLIWPLIGRFQIRREIKKSIYYNKIINQTFKEDYIEIYADRVHQKIKYHDLRYRCQINHWIILEREKSDDYLLIKSNSA
jgi:hypothetical protein